MAIEKVGVVGCGLMGSGIAQVAAAAGCQVTVREVSPQLVEKGLQSIEKNLGRLVEKGKLAAAERDQIRGCLRGTTNLEDLASTDFVIEAVVENEDAKIDDFILGEMVSQHIPGVSLAVNKDGQTIFAKGYGQANLEHQVAVKPETVFQSGSMGNNLRQPQS